MCDAQQNFCLGLALWNGVDPILKERAFGLTGPEGNHGEDVKDYWWYLDSTPTHSWMSWRYHYPQREFPYGDLVAENARRGQDQPEYELVDTGVVRRRPVLGGDRRLREGGPARPARDGAGGEPRTGRGDAARAAHPVVPQLLGLGPARPRRACRASRQRAVPCSPSTPRTGRLTLTGDGSPALLFCDNETNTERLFGVAGRSRYPKDGINDHLVRGADSVNPDLTGTKAALHYTLDRARRRHRRDPAPAGRGRRPGRGLRTCSAAGTTT